MKNTPTPNQSVEELKQKFRNMPIEDLEKLIAQGEERNRELGETIERLLQKSIEIGKQIEEIQSRTKKEIKTTLKEKAQESPEKIWNNSIRRIQLLTRKYSGEIMEAFKNYKKQKGEKSLEKSKEGLEKELTITNQLYGKAHMDVSIDGLYTSKLFNAKIDAEDLINANNYSIKDLNKLKDNLQKVNNSIRKKYPLLLPSKKELEIIKKDNEELLKRMRSILSKEKLFLTEDKKTTLERFVDTMVGELKDISKNCKSLVDKKQKIEDYIKETQKEIDEAKNKQEKLKKEEKEKKIAYKKAEDERQKKNKREGKERKKQNKRDKKQQLAGLSKEDKGIITEKVSEIGEIRKMIEDLQDKHEKQKQFQDLLEAEMASRNKTE